VCATLAIPLPVMRNQADQLLDQDENVVEKQKKLAGLLSLTAAPTRKQLVQDLVSHAEISVTGRIVTITITISIEQ